MGISGFDQNLHKTKSKKPTFIRILYIKIIIEPFLIDFFNKKGQNPDYETPVVISRANSTIADFCNRIHRSMLKNFKHAMVWGSSVKYNPQKVGKEHQLLDEDVVQIIKKI